MSNYPFKGPVDRQRVDLNGARAILDTFEDAWAKQSENRITSAQFYDRYTTGEFDSMFHMAWASYYEIYRDMGHSGNAAAIVDQLAAVG